MNRRIIVIIVVFLVILLAASLFVLFDNDDGVESEYSIWQNRIENFATGLAVNNGKVYIIDISGNICSYGTEYGNKNWQGSIGAYWGEGVTASNSMVYGGKAAGEVGAIDSKSGQFKWSAHTQHDSTWDNKAPSNITVLENRLYITAYSFNVFNATTGELLWEYEKSYGQGKNVTAPNSLIGWAFEENRVFAVAGVIFDGYYICRLNPNTGTIIWSVRISDYIPGPPTLYKGQVILTNGTGTQTEVISLNENTGALLWSYNVGESVINPTTTINNLLLFETNKGNVYAINMSNGKQAWKTYIDNDNIISFVNSDRPLKGCSVQIDTQNRRAIAGFAVKTQLGAFVQEETDEYVGFLCSLDLDNGSIVWARQFSGSGEAGHLNADFYFAMSENNVFLSTEFNDFWILDKSTGEMLEQQQFEHYILPPVADGEKVYVAADLHLVAFK
ncbi:MAG: PQQ-binding-like beta-propeller repeat protein [Candidatus Bathyarchaeota archaeon]|nr:PQQ-binding-like beta-propeller repeat protein [Candidatus Bathyarchaeota archaeon]